MCASVQSAYKEVWIPPKQNLPDCSWVLISRSLNQCASQILNLDQFVAEEADRTSHCEENFRSEGKTCAPDKAQPPSHQSKKAIIDKATLRVKAAPAQRGPQVTPTEERLRLPVQASLKFDHCLTPISMKTQTILRHEPHIREPDGKEYWPRLMHIVSDPHSNSRSWNFSKWLDALSDASDRVRFEHCLD